MNEKPSTAQNSHFAELRMGDPSGRPMGVCVPIRAIFELDASSSNDLDFGCAVFPPQVIEGSD